MTKFEKLCGVYRYFAEGESASLDFSREAMIHHMSVENGAGHARPDNGFTLGQRLSSITLAMWTRDIEAGRLMKFELYEDPELKDIQWWIRPRIARVVSGANVLIGRPPYKAFHN